MVKSNNDIKGIEVDGVEFYLTQFADDTTIFQNGSENLLKAAMATLDFFLHVCQVSK